MFVVGPENPPSRLRLLFEISYRHHQIASNTVAHDGCPLTHRIEIGQVSLPRLFACISEERGTAIRCKSGCPTRQSRKTRAWGEEIMDSFETASELVVRLLANSRSRRPAPRSKSECTRHLIPIRRGTSAARVFHLELPAELMPFARSWGGTRIMSLDASSYSKVAAGLATSTSIFGSGPRVQRMSDVGHFVPLGPFRCRRSP